MRAVHTLVLLAFICASTTTPAAAQQASASVSGRIIGPDESALSDQTVVLHRVQGAQGETVATAVTLEDGGFVLEFPLQADPAALYFVATRYEGELYIGAPFRAGEQDPAGQLIQVGVPGTSATAMLEGGGAMPQPIGRPATSRNWLLLVIPLMGVAAVALYALIPRSRVPPDRALLIRIAELDERMGSAPDAQRAALREERLRLAAQLRAG
jgi:hypothetical protein